MSDGQQGSARGGQRHRGPGHSRGVKLPCLSLLVTDFPQRLVPKAKMIRHGINLRSMPPNMDQLEAGR